MKTKFVHVSNEIYLGSAQKEALSSSGTISETQTTADKQETACLPAYEMQLREKQFNTNTDSNESSRQLTAARIWFSPPLQETIR